MRHFSAKCDHHDRQGVSDCESDNIVVILQAKAKSGTPESQAFCDRHSVPMIGWYKDQGKFNMIRVNAQ